jgi:hypothetical protein
VCSSDLDKRQFAFPTGYYDDDYKKFFFRYPIVTHKLCHILYPDKIKFKNLYQIKPEEYYLIWHRLSYLKWWFEKSTATITNHHQPKKHKPLKLLNICFHTIYKNDLIKYLL